MSRDLLVELELAEQAALWAALGALRIDELEGECVWLRLEPTCHRWVVSTQLGRFDLVVHQSHEAHVGRWFPVSERVLRFADECAPDEVSLYLVDDTVVASCDGMSAAIDLVSTRQLPPSQGDLAVAASATVTGARLRRAIRAARILPAGAADVDWLSPPMWLRLSAEELALHVDWTDVLQSRSTYRIDVERGTGDTTVSFAHAVVAGFVERMAEPDELLTLSVGNDSRVGDGTQVLWVEGQHWQFATLVRDTLDERWTGRIVELCDEQHWTVRERVGHAWAINVGDCEVHLELQHGHPDIARVSVAVATGLEESMALLAELNSLNLASAGRRFVLHEGSVHVTTDVRLSDFPMLRVAVGEVVFDARRYGALLGIHATA